VNQSQNCHFQQLVDELLPPLREVDLAVLSETFEE
jgi:hypothetical protein